MLKYLPLRDGWCPTLDVDLSKCSHRRRHTRRPCWVAIDLVTVSAWPKIWGRQHWPCLTQPRHPEGVSSVLAGRCSRHAGRGGGAAHAALGRTQSRRGRGLAEAQRRPKAWHSLRVDPIYVGGHWTPQLIQRGGLHELNEATEAKGEERQSFAVPPEEVVWPPPELVILCPGLNLEMTYQEAMRSAGVVGRAPAVRAGQVVMVDGDAMFNRPGPRLVDCLECQRQCCFRIGCPRTSSPWLQRHRPLPPQRQANRRRVGHEGGGQDGGGEGGRAGGH